MRMIVPLLGTFLGFRAGRRLLLYDGDLDLVKALIVKKWLPLFLQ